MARRGARSMKLLCITLLAAALSGVGAQASIVEEISGSAAAPGVATSLLATSSEITLGARASLALSSIQDLPEDRAYVTVRRHTFGEKAQLQLTVAQVGAVFARPFWGWRSVTRPSFHATRRRPSTK